MLKVMSKMGISDVASYRGARLFEAVGLDRTSLPRATSGARPPPSVEPGSSVSSAKRSARLAASRAERPQLENPGYYKFRKGGEPHATDPDVVDALQEAVAGAHALQHERCETDAPISTTVSRLSSTSRAPLEPRDLLELVPAGPPVPLEEVEPAEVIVRRFSSGAMSHGALSAEAHETIAIALNRLGAKVELGRRR